MSKNNTTQTRVPYHHQPTDISIEQWQIALRRQFAATHYFNITKLGEQPVFTDYNVYNPETKNTYKVAIRSSESSSNFCSCLDFKTNCLGTCKHIEAVMHQIKSKPNLAVLLNNGYSPSYTSVYIKYGYQRQVMIRLGTNNNEAFTAFTQKYFDTDLCLLPMAYYNIEQVLTEAKNIDESFRCYPDALDFILEVREKRRRQQVIDSKYNPLTETGNFNSLIKTKLFPFQQQGIWFAAKAGKLLLADDMGLGKTIQAIATAELYRTEFFIERVLVVCPTSLKYQWKTEIEKFTNSTVKVLEGHALKRSEVYKTDNSFYHIVSYHTVINDWAEINKMAPDLIILDEAQRIKNYKTRIANSVKRLTSPYAIVLTGTPIENKLEELYSIIQFVDPYSLGPFYKFLAEHQIKNEFGKVVGYKSLNNIAVALADCMLRRTKTEVLTQLPERTDKVLFVPMTTEQINFHEDYKGVVAKLVERWKRHGFLNEKDRQRLMISMNMMRMVCDSTYIIDQQTRFDNKIDELMNLLFEILQMENEKVVIFSQWERMTRLVAAELTKHDIGFEYLHGGIPSENRNALFQNFNNKPSSRIFLSTDAGGVGLNLQAASYLINLDIPWNPAVLEQRIARIYRLGQKRNVNIINLVSIGSIEHRMLDVLKFKSAMAEGVLDNGEDSIFMGDDKFKQFMNTVESLAQPTATNELVTDEDEKTDLLSDTELTNTLTNITQSETPVPVSLTDDDVIDNTNSIQSENIITSTSATTPDLISAGANFFAQLSKTMADPIAKEKLLSNIIETDAVTGQNYLKIPVQDQQTIVSAFEVMAKMFDMFKK